MRRTWLIALAMSQSAFADPTAVLDSAVADGRVPGVVAMAATSDKIIFAHAAGAADGERPMTLDAVFSIASMTKPVTSVAMMQLVEQGRVDLDASMFRYLPDLEAKPVLLRVDDDGPILSEQIYEPTIRQLLSHTSGFGYSIWNEHLFAITDFANFTPTYFLEQPLIAVPGTEWNYSTSTDWSGFIVERVAGQDLEAYFAEHIFIPLGMVDTSYVVSERMRPRVVTLHLRDANGELTPMPSGDFPPPSFYSGGAGLYSTARDYVRFMQMLLKGGSGVLSAATVETMSRNQSGELEIVEMKTAMPSFSNDFAILPDVATSFGLGFQINEEDLPGRRARGSLAWGGLNNTYFWIDPKNDVCGVLLTQIRPFYDAAVVDLLAEFEAAIYAHFAEE